MIFLRTEKKTFLKTKQRSKNYKLAMVRNKNNLKKQDLNISGAKVTISEIIIIIIIMYKMNRKYISTPLTF